MARLLSIARAAKLVGVPRGTLQKQIFNGEIESFEGQIKFSDLERLYPQTELEDNTIIEHIEEIIELALKRARGEKLRALLTPDLGTLAARVSALSKELDITRQRESYYIELLSTLKDKINTQLNTNDKNFCTDLRDWLEEALKEPVIVEKSSALFTKDTLLKVVAAQVHLMPSGHEYFIEGNNSILESGLSAGLALNYGCSNGNCGKCKARLISGDVKKIKPYDYNFSETEKSQNYILTCCHTALTDVVLEAEEAGSEHDIPEQQITARVKKITPLDENLMLLHLKTPRTNRLRFLAGQNAMLKISDSDVPEESFAIASCPCDDMNIQFHVKRNNESALVTHIFNQLSNSDNIDITGPTGHFVLKENSDNPVLFIAFNEGFAAIKSLIEHAMTLDNAEFIHLFWIVTGDNTHYLQNQCRAWTDALDNFRYTPLKIRDSENEELLNDRLEQISSAYRRLSELDIYIDGTESLIDKTARFLQNAGANEAQIVTRYTG
ncbi:MAG: 2Fe-2S iron-sulfur cluster-binding protein [Gammaproteobacteria bacterium]